MGPALLALMALLVRAPLALQPPTPDAPLTRLGPDALSPVFPMSEPLATALATRDHAAAATQLKALGTADLPGRALGDHSYLLAWSQVRAGDPASAVTLLEAVRRAETTPEPYRLLVEAELLKAAGEPVKAAATLARVAPESRVWSRARLEQAEALFAAGSTAESREIYRSLAARPDPAEGSDTALWVLAQRAGLGSDEAYALLRRAWKAYPTSKAGKDAAKELAAYEARGARYKPSRAEISARAAALDGADRHDDVVALLSPTMASFATLDAVGCRASYAYGRALFKKNRLGDAITTLSPLGKACVGQDDDAGARALYIAGKAQERKKAWAEAAKLYEQIPLRYPAHSMADDGYAMAGIGWQEAGDGARAIKLWEAQVAAYPDGDLAAEGFWRLAWSRYLAGDPAGAIAWAEKMLWEVPLETDPVHVLAGRYWSARWRIYPSVSAPDALSDSAADRAQGVRLLVELCREHPTSYYGILAADRLYELAPEDLEAVARPAWGKASGALWVRQSFLEEPAVKAGLALARLGLVRDAMAELAALPEELLTPSELALVTRIQARVDPIVAHNRLHHFLLQHPPATLGKDAEEILRQAYPDLYWQELQEVSADYDWDPRVFHGLVREESSFNPKIVSWAGARGLSQLMPATAREVAGWLGMSVTNDQLFDPKTNLKIGTRFFESLVSRYKSSFFLATASYNAGPGNVDAWLKRFGNGPADEFVERIPIRETRHYVKRVLGTYQVYHVLYDPSPLFADWSATNHNIKPSGSQ